MPFLAAAVGTLCLVASAMVFPSTRVAADQDSATVERRAWAMGTRLLVNIEARDRGTAVGASEAALRAVAEVEARLSTWSHVSELSRLNSAEAGLNFAISPSWNPICGWPPTGGGKPAARSTRALRVWSMCGICGVAVASPLPAS